MNADLTFNSVVFKKSYDSKDESVRQSSARGLNTPDVLSIKSQDYTDQATKVAGRRHTISVDYHQIDAELRPIVGRAYVVLAIPETIADANVATFIATFKAAVADADLFTAVLNNEK
jgi:hypothetical protein